jgi:hypothetical protein
MRSDNLRIQPGCFLIAWINFLRPAELAKIQNTSIGGKMNLPRFLYNDLISLKRYHPKWIRKIDIAQKHALLLTIVQR